MILRNKFGQRIEVPDQAAGDIGNMLMNKQHFAVNKFIKQIGQKPVDPMLSNIYSKYPAFKNMGEVTLKADPNFTVDKTGAGSIEYFSNQQGRDKITYNTGYSYPHPKPGTHGIVYNPNGNNEQDVMLDMLHGMTVDPVYNKHRSEFASEFIKNNEGDFNADWDRYNKETEGDNDGINSFKENWIDGQIRGLMFEGDPDDFEKHRYWPDAKNVYLSNQNVKDKFIQLQNYLKTGKGYVLPEVTVKPK